MVRLCTVFGTRVLGVTNAIAVIQHVAFKGLRRKINMKCSRVKVNRNY